MKRFQHNRVVMAGLVALLVLSAIQLCFACSMSCFCGPYTETKPNECFAYLMGDSCQDDYTPNSWGACGGTINPLSGCFDAKRQGTDMVYHWYNTTTCSGGGGRSWSATYNFDYWERTGTCSCI